MKRKLFQILMMVAVTVTLGVFVSCKDTNEDLYRDLDLRLQKIEGNATIPEAVQQQLKNMEEQLKLYKEKLDQIKSCECGDMSKTIEDMKKDIEALKAAQVDPETIKTLTDNYTTILNFVTNVAVSKEELEEAVKMLEAKIAEATGGYDLAKLAEIEKTASDALALAQDAASRIEEAKKAATEAKELAEAADKLSKVNTEAISKIELQLVSMSDSLKHAYETADQAWAQAKGNKEAIETMSEIVNANKEALAGIKDDVSTLYNKVDSLSGEIEDLKKEITKLYEYSDANLEKAKAYTDLEVALVRADIAQINVDVFNLREDLNDAVDEIEGVKEAVAEVNDSLGKLDNRVTENATKIAEVEDKLDKAMEAFQEKIDNLQGEIDDLTERVKKNEEDIADILGQLDKLREDLAKQVTGIIVQGTVNPAFGTINLPVNIQSNVLLTYYGKTNHDIVFPTNDPTYYVDDRFVLSWKDLYMCGLNGSAPIFKSGDVILQNDEYNAGTLYLTVNPNTIDFSHLNLSLVNSQDEESYIKLGELRRSDKVLQLGYSRAADNGFYQCYANVNAEDVNKVQKIKVDASGLKEDIKALMDKHSASDIMGLAIDLAKVVQSLKLDANAVKCEWEDTEGQKHSVYSNYNIAATAVEPLSLESYKDLNYKKVPGYDRVMSYIDRAANKIKNEIEVVFDNVQGQPVVKKIQNLTINKVEIGDLDQATLNKFNISKTIVIDNLEYNLDLNENVDLPIKFSQTVDFGTVHPVVPSLIINASNQAAINVPVKDKDNNEVGTATIPVGDITITGSSKPTVVDVTIGTQTITVDKTVTTTIKLNKVIKLDSKSFTVDVNMEDAIKDLWQNVQTEVGGVNTTLEQVEDIVKDVNTLLDELNDYKEKINTKVDEYKDQLTSYITKINNKLVNFINNTNLRMQPVLFASDDQGTKVLSEAKEYPSVMGKDINFVATTWNLELLAPMAKKHVAVTDVINGEKSAKGDDATCLAELKRVNSAKAMNTVLPGDINRTYATNLKSGYIYEIAYSALDFHGKIATRKYYIRIK